MHNPNLANVVTALLVGLSFGIGLLAVMFLFGVLRPQSVRRGSETVRTSPGRCFLVGLLTLLVCIGGFVLFKALGRLGGVLAVALALVFAYWLLSGLAMLAHSIGERVQTALMAKSLGSDAMAVVYGAVPLLAVGFLPVVGQLIQLVAITTGLGAAMSALFAHRQAETQPPPPVPSSA
jgi:hypothetical protein